MDWCAANQWTGMQSIHSAKPTGFAVAPDGCRLAYHLDGNAASPDKVRNAKSGELDFALSLVNQTSHYLCPPRVVLLLQKREISFGHGFACSMCQFIL
jgi:hypothetical protein